MKQFILLISLIAFSANTYFANAQHKVTVDFNKIVKPNLNKGAASANICWLLDSDLKRPNAHRSMEEALTDVGVGALRFPYGHLADNYFWHTPPYNDTKNGLRPAIATMSRPPAKWSWAVNSDKSFNKAMDFDEFMALCQRNNIKPLVVVNILSHKYPDGPSIETLATSAAEWVRYAKKKNYNVAYWQIGNEIDHHPKTITLQEFVKAYKIIASAMKEVNPDINVGPGILGKHSYFTTLYNAAPELVDFTSCHQYMFKHIKTCPNYDMWSKSTENYISNVTNMQRAVLKTDKKDMEILITETGVSPSNRGIGNINNGYKALWWFEVLMSELKVKNVAYSFFWGSHSPWKGETDKDDDDVAVMFRVDDNSSKPTAVVSSFVNANIKDNVIGAFTNNQALRTYAMANKGKKGGVIFIMNKLQELQNIELVTKNLPKSVSSLKMNYLMAEQPLSRTLNLKQSKDIAITRNAGSDTPSQTSTAISIPALSIVALSY